MQSAIIFYSSVQINDHNYILKISLVFPEKWMIAIEKKI